MLIRHEYSSQGKIVVGVDECGVGALCGPVVGCAIILKNDFSHPDIKDSKKLSEKKRLNIEGIIKDNCISYQIAQISAFRIDQIGIFNATLECLEKCLYELNSKFDLALIDGERWRNVTIPHQLVIKGDNTYQEIAAASILAKNYRDNLMKELSLEFPIYGWEKNAGYGTKIHIDGLLSNGHTIHHRKTFISKYI